MADPETDPETSIGAEPVTVTKAGPGATPGFALNIAGVVIHADGRRERVTELGWTDITPEQLARIADVLSENDPFYVVKEADVGKAVLRAFGRAWQLSNSVGPIQAGDVGRRVYRTGEGATASLGMENARQFAERTGAAERPGA